MPREKVFGSCAAAVADVFDGATVLIGGALGCEGPQGLIEALAQRPVGGLTCVFSPGAAPDAGGFSALEPLIANGQVVKLITAFPWLDDNGLLEKQRRSGKLEIESLPQGTLAERLRAGGAGLGGVFIPTGAGTRFGGGKETRTVNGRECVLELPLKGDFALFRAYRADSLGNVVYRGAGRNLGPTMAMAARVSIAEVDEVCQPGGIDPETVISSGIFVNRVVESPQGSTGRTAE